MTSFDHSHSRWTAVLERVSRRGMVDYELLAADASDLEAYLEDLGSVDRKQYRAWSNAEQLAFWINAYNAFTVKLMARHHPVRGIRAIGWFPGWAFLTPVVRLAGLRRTLNLYWLEHLILRRKFDEPRVHFAINCASFSCPRLRPEAYRAADLDEQLEDAARSFLRDPTHNRVDRDRRVLQLSSLFRWFRSDFGATEEAVVAWTMRYFRQEDRRWVRTHWPIRVEYLPYDWSAPCELPESFYEAPQKKGAAGMATPSEGWR